MSHETSVCTNQQSLSFKLVGDNLDKNVKARYMCVGGSHNQSYHFFHSFAVLDRIDFSTLPDVHPHLCLNSPKKRALAILPSIDDDTTLRKFFVTHVSRVLVKHMAFFKLTFEDVVEWHIRHQYYTEMSAKSEVVHKYDLHQVHSCPCMKVDSANLFLLFSTCHLLPPYQSGTTWCYPQE